MNPREHNAYAQYEEKIPEFSSEEGEMQFWASPWTKSATIPRYFNDLQD